MDNISQKGMRRRVRWGRVVTLLIAIIMFLAIAAAVGWFIYNEYFSVQAKMAAATNEEGLDKRINILLIGVDDGANASSAVTRRADANILISINPENNTLILLTIPRDTRVNLSGSKGPDKINSAYSIGGAELSLHTVESLLHISIQHYIAVDWQAFIKIIDVLGGIDLYVEKDMDYEDPYQNLEIHLTKGFQHLDGNKAGQYVSFCKDEFADIGRVLRQQLFLKTCIAEKLDVNAILKLTELGSIINHCVMTDMNIITMLKIINSIKKIKPQDVHAEILPGNSVNVGGLNYWSIDNTKAQVLVETIFEINLANKGNKNKQ